VSPCLWLIPENRARYFSWADSSVAAGRPRGMCLRACSLIASAIICWRSSLPGK
jgi:hypothetical protein